MTPTKRNDEEFDWLLCLAAAFQASQRYDPTQPDKLRHARPRFLRAILRAWKSRFQACKWLASFRSDGGAEA